MNMIKDQTFSLQDLKLKVYVLGINPGNRIKFLIFQFGLRAGNLEEEDLLHWDPLDPLIVWYFITDQL